MPSKEIIAAVKGGKCILFLGAMASAPSPEGSPFGYDRTKAPPGGRELARRLADQFCYDPNDPEGRTNLQRVALYSEFYQRAGGDVGSRKSLVEAVVREIGRPTADTPEGFQIEPSPALRMLAALPFRIIITTNYDHLFDTALGDAHTLDGRRKDPIKRIYDPTQTTAPDEVPIDFEEQKPVLLKLHGDIDMLDSIVITEEDYITFVQRMMSQHFHPVHQYIRMRMRAWPFLFVGYGLRDYNLRLLFRTLKWELDDAHYPVSFSVDPYPDDIVAAVWQRSRQREVEFIKEDLWSFIPALYREVLGKEFQP